MPDAIREHTIELEQLFRKSLQAKGDLDVKVAILQTMVFDEEMILPLY